MLSSWPLQHQQPRARPQQHQQQQQQQQAPCCRLCSAEHRWHMPWQGVTLQQLAELQLRQLLWQAQPSHMCSSFAGYHRRRTPGTGASNPPGTPRPALQHCLHLVCYGIQVTTVALDCFVIMHHSSMLIQQLSPCQVQDFGAGGWPSKRHTPALTDPASMLRHTSLMGWGLMRTVLLAVGVMKYDALRVFLPLCCLPCCCCCQCSAAVAVLQATWSMLCAPHTTEQVSSCERRS